MIIDEGLLFPKMPQCCAVPMCANKTGGHKFPMGDKNRLQQWLVAISRDFTPTKHSRVCKSHFTADDYELPKDSVLAKPRPVLKKTAVPSQFKWSDQQRRHQLKKERQRNAKKICVKVPHMNCEEEDDTLLMGAYCCKVEIEEKQKDVEIQCDLGENKFVSAFGTQQICHNAQIGIAIEPEANVQLHASLVAERTTNEYVSFAQKMLESLVNYVASFTVTQDQMTPTPGVAYVPMPTLHSWYQNFERRLQTNPNFWKN